MNFDDYTLKKLAKEGSRIGNWNGKAVFAAGTAQLDNLGSSAYYILYDDENKIVAETSDGWKSYGEVSEAGVVNEYRSARNYRTPAETAAAARKAKEERSSAAMPQTSGMRYSAEPIPQATMTGGTYAPGYDVSERPVGDVKAEIDVEKVLKSAREMSVESLLDGFLANINFEAKG